MDPGALLLLLCMGTGALLLLLCLGPGALLLLLCLSLFARLLLPGLLALFSDADFLGALLSIAWHFEETILVRQARDVGALMEMDGIELASGRADAASEAAILVDVRCAASEAARRLGLEAAPL